MKNNSTPLRNFPTSLPALLDVVDDLLKVARVGEHKQKDFRKNVSESDDYCRKNFMCWIHKLWLDNWCQRKWKHSLDDWVMNIQNCSQTHKTHQSLPNQRKSCASCNHKTVLKREMICKVISMKFEGGEERHLIW